MRRWSMAILLRGRRWLAVRRARGWDPGVGGVCVGAEVRAGVRRGVVSGGVIGRAVVFVRVELRCGGGVRVVGVGVVGVGVGGVGAARGGVAAAVAVGATGAIGVAGGGAGGVVGLVKVGAGGGNGAGGRDLIVVRCGGAVRILRGAELLRVRLLRGMLLLRRRAVAAWGGVTTGHFVFCELRCGLVLVEEVCGRAGLRGQYIPRPRAQEVQCRS